MCRRAVSFGVFDTDSGGYFGIGALFILGALTVVLPASLAEIVVAAEVAPIPRLAAAASSATAPAWGIATVAEPAVAVVGRVCEGVKVPRVLLWD